MITGILLASGHSNRFGENKLLTTLDDKPLFTYGLDAYNASNLDSIIVVTRFIEIIDYCLGMNIQVVHNHNAHLGQSQSIILGVSASKQDSDYMFAPLDQPLITTKAVNHLISSFNANATKIIQPTTNDIPTSPTIFPNHYRSQLLDISGDMGGRNIIQANPSGVLKVPIDGSILLDVDTPEDFDIIKGLI